MAARTKQVSFEDLASSCREADVVERIRAVRSAVAGRIVFMTSFGLEDQVLTHLIDRADVDVDVVTLDTGRLFPETYAVWAETERRYGLRIRAFYPRTPDIEDLVARQGIDGFYQTVDARKACCNARKVEPLRRALVDAGAWVTGLRADQSTARTDVAFVALDDAYGLLKVSPLFDWTRTRLVDFAAGVGVPLNVLHDKGYPSIGCAPCTRAVAAGEPERAGRWWWENEGQQECGLHVAPDGRLVRGSPASDDAR